jgi:hypothetical protein
VSLGDINKKVKCELKKDKNLEKSFFLVFSQRTRGSPPQWPLMKHSSTAGVTRLGHPKKEFDFSFGFRLGHPKKEFDFFKKTTEP